MADVLNREQRHRCMSAVKGRDTKPELLVRKFLFSRGFRYRLNHPRLPGHPDLVLRKYRTVIFVNGCFWHGHDNCRYFRLPKTNIDFWQKKIERNKERDKLAKEALMQMGWAVMTIWECQLKPAMRKKTLLEMEYYINHSYLARLKTQSSKSYTLEEIPPNIAAEDKGKYEKSNSLNIIEKPNK